MKIAILTTKSTHHAYFIKKIQQLKFEVDVFLEKNKVFTKYQVKHDIDKKITDYERKKFFNNKNSLYKQYFKNVKEYQSFNSKSFVFHLSKKKYNLVIVFGAGILKKKIIKSFKNIIFNLHGGDPEIYRGLDSIYWSIFNNQYEKLVTTLHQLDYKIDTGKIFKKKKIFICKNMKFYQVRYYNTINCVKLTYELIDRLYNKKKIFLKKQKLLGMYFTAMPKSLKSYCIKKFENFTKQI